MAQIAQETMPGGYWRTVWQRPATTGARGRQRGFTLVELLVVVSIIALLISILLPSLKQAREQAKSVKCLAHSRGLGQATMTFATDHNGRMQLSSSNAGRTKADPDYKIFEYGSVSQTTLPKRELLAWPAALAQASGIPLKDNWDWGVRATGMVTARNHERDGHVPQNFELTVCPSDRIQLSTPFYPNGTQLVGQGDPKNPIPTGATTSYWGRLSYAINEDIAGADLGAVPSCWKDGHKGEDNDALAGARLEGRLDRVFDPGTALLMIDAGADSDTDDQPLNLVISAQANGPFLKDFQVRWNQRLPEKRHPKGQLNVTYADGHGAATRPVDFKMYGRVGPYPSAYSPETRVSPYQPRNLPVTP